MQLTDAAQTVPALAAALIRSDEIQTEVVGDAEPGDAFHLGSNAKAMTATLAAIAVERGLIDWTSSPADDRPEVTLERLLAHSAGIRPLTEDDELVGLPEDRSVVAALLLAEPAVDSSYSNGGYTIAAAMLEAATGSKWETLLQDWLAEPLSIQLGVGWPPRVRGHYDRDGTLVEHDHADGYRLHPAIVPAGDVHASIDDYARFVQLHLRGLRGRAELITADSFTKLHTPLHDNFALGWGVQPWEGATTSVHTGSAETFLALVAVQPERDIAVAAMTNAAGDAALAAVVEVARSLIRTAA